MSEKLSAKKNTNAPTIIIASSEKKKNLKTDYLNFEK